MSERQGLLPWPSDGICDKVSAAMPHSEYIREQFIFMAQHNRVVASELELTSRFFEEFGDYCGEMHLFAGLQTHLMLYLASQENKQKLPFANRSIVEVIEHSLEEADDYVKETFERLKEDNPPVHGYLHELCKSRDAIKNGPAAMKAIKSGGIFVYSMLELQAEADKLGKQLKQ